MRILIVDDDPAFCLATERYLRARGYETETAGDGIEALESINRQKPDVVICDVRMPGLDGISLLKKVRVTNTDLPFVMTTAYASDDLAIEAERGGRADLLEKPIDQNQLLECLRKSRLNR